MSSSDGLTDPVVDRKASKLLSMFPLSWATVDGKWSWCKTMDSDGDDSLQSRGCKVDHGESRRNIKDPSKKIIPISCIFSFC